MRFPHIVKKKRRCLGGRAIPQSDPCQDTLITRRPEECLCMAAPCASRPGLPGPPAAPTHPPLRSCRLGPSRLEVDQTNRCIRDLPHHGVPIS